MKRVFKIKAPKPKKVMVNFRMKAERKKLAHKELKKLKWTWEDMVEDFLWARGLK